MEGESDHFIVESIRKNLPDILKLLVALIAGSLTGGLFKGSYNAQSALVTLSLAVVVFAAYFMHLVLLSRAHTDLHNELIQKTIDKMLGKYETELAKKEDWFYKMEKLQHFEMDHVKHDEIWVVSSDLQYEVEDDLFFKIVKNNLNHGVRYKYIYPDDKKAQQAVRQIQTSFEDCKFKPEMHAIYNDAFDYPCDIIIFNPNFHQGRNRRLNIFMELKINRDIKDRAWVRIDNSLAGVIKSSIQKDIDENSTFAISQKFKELMDRFPGMQVGVHENGHLEVSSDRKETRQPRPKK